MTGDAANDDWAPLPSDDLCARPGEACDVHKKAPPPPPPPESPPAVPPPVAAAPTPPDPAAERALAALKQKLAATAPATSLVATVQHREQRAERKRKAATSATACAATLVKAPDAVAAAPAAAAVTGPAAAGAAPETTAGTDAETDPRESLPWFRALPHAEQERLRARWWLVKHRHDDGGLILRKRLERALGYGALCFFVLSVLQALLAGGFVHVPLYTAAGALAAGVAEICKGGRYVYAIAGTVAFMAVMGPMNIGSVFNLFTLMIAAYGMGAIGMDGEMRRSGGFREK